MMSFKLRRLSCVRVRCLVLGYCVVDDWLVVNPFQRMTC